ncbi:MAG: membrane protein insertion efficiency factor YidD [Candidatus Riflebacteria bacterium]|nr:membrane protein insertion efficiency factor YidD [Candidatus Riflebacteria bacterium]
MFAIRLYQKTLSPFLGGVCRFTPSCSKYTHEAIVRYGFIKGWALGVWRILRCNPFCSGGNDPVP